MKEELCEETNNILIQAFKESMVQQNLGTATVRNHYQNVRLFVNDYLLFEEIAPEDGYDEISEFLGDWAIRKNVIISEYALRQYASSLKKFYQFLCGKGRIDKKVLQSVNQTIKDEMPEWVENLREFEEEMELYDEYDDGDD